MVCKCDKGYYLSCAGFCLVNRQIPTIKHCQNYSIWVSEDKISRCDKGYNLSCVVFCLVNRKTPTIKHYHKYAFWFYQDHISTRSGFEVHMALPMLLSGPTWLSCCWYPAKWGAKLAICCLNFFGLTAFTLPCNGQVRVVLTGLYMQIEPSKLIAASTGAACSIHRVNKSYAH